MRIIIDNNVLISASLLDESIPALAFVKAKDLGVLLSTADTIKELSLTLLKEKFNKYVDVDKRIDFLFKYKEISKLTPITHSVNICRDPKDNMYLELALSGKADAIITGDADLLVLHPFCNIPIITPKYFFENY